MLITNILSVKVQNWIFLSILELLYGILTQGMKYFMTHAKNL